MNRSRVRQVVAPAAVLALALGLAACGGADAGQSTSGQDLSGTINADGSSTVAPLTTAAAELFQSENPQVRVTVGTSGTGGGFEKFCAGETDVSDASRPIEPDEAKVCKQEGISYEELHVANDALTVVVNKQNDWVDCLTTEQLRKMWEPGSKVNNWNQVDPKFPNEPIELFGPGTDSGTFDYFTEEVNGEEGASRTDYSPSEDDNVIVNGVAGEKGGLGYFGYTYYEQNTDKLKAVEIDDGDGCVAPSVETAQSGEYSPLARPLYIYPSTQALTEEHVKEFVRFYAENDDKIADAAQFIPLDEQQKAELTRTAEKITS